MANTEQANDQNEQPVATQPTGQPDATPAGASPTSGSPDNQAGAPNTPPQTPQQPQDASSAQNGPQGPSGGPQKQGDLSKTPGTPPTANPSDPADHPAVQKAGIIRAIAQTLAGGPQTSYKIDPNTGTMVATKQPLSGHQIGLAIAMAALTGGISGLGEKGPGAEGRAAQDGFKATQQQAQQQDQQAQQQASQNYARQAAVATTNFQTHENAMRLGQMDKEIHDGYIKDAAPALENLRNVGAVQESGVREGDLLTKYHVTKDMAIVDGTVPRMGPGGKQATNKDGSLAWDNTYSVIDPQKKIALPDDTAKLLADHHVPGYFQIVDGKTVPTNFQGSAPIKAGLVVNGIALASGIKITEAAINKQLGSLGKDAGSEQSAFQLNLRSALESGDVTGKALQAFAPYSGLPLDKAFDEMRKNKVDPQLVGQVESLIPQDAKEQMKIQRTNQEATAKAGEARQNLVVSKNNFEDVLADPKNYSSGQVAAAQKMQNTVRSEKRQDEYNAGSLHEQGEIDVKKKNGIPLSGNSQPQDDTTLSHPELAKLIQDPANYNTPNGTNDKYLAALNQVDPRRAALIKAYSEGRDIQSLYATAKAYGGNIAGDLHAYDPSFNVSDMRTYDKTIQESGASGKLGKTNAAASTGLEHLGRLYDHYGASGVASGVYDTDLNQAATETASFYANGNKPGEQEIKHAHDSLDHKVMGWRGKNAAVETATEMMDKVEENYNQYDKDLPKGIKRVGPLSTTAANSYEKMTGKHVDPRLVRWQAPTDLPPASGAANGTVAKGADGKPVAKVRDGQWIWP